MAEITFPTKFSFFNTLAKLIDTCSKSPKLLEIIQGYFRAFQSSKITFLPEIQGFDSQESLETEFMDYINTSLVPISPQAIISDSPNYILEPQGDPDRIYMDGCFDLMHSGHYNAIRQAKALGKFLVVGVHSDAEIARNKGPPVMNEIERYALARSCKWVDEVVENAPYSPTIELLNSLNCRYAAHGDDLSINENGDDCMSILKRAGRCKIFKRTEGISTTQLVGKLLLMTKDVWEKVDTPVTSSSVFAKEVETTTQGNKKHLLTTSRRISEFSNKKESKPDDIIVYIDGTFDLFHVGHIETLKRAKSLGNYLIVGVHDDETVNKYKGSNFPIMNLHDRVMCVLSNKFVDEVIIGAPWVVSRELITGFNIKIVVQGTELKSDPSLKKCRKGSIDVDEDPFTISKELGIYHEIESVSKINTQTIIDRIIDNRTNFFNKFKTFAQKEINYDKTKEYIQEV